MRACRRTLTFDGVVRGAIKRVSATHVFATVRVVCVHVPTRKQPEQAAQDAQESEK